MCSSQAGASPLRPRNELAAGVRLSGCQEAHVRPFSHLPLGSHCAIVGRNAFGNTLGFKLIYATMPRPSTHPLEVCTQALRLRSLPILSEGLGAYLPSCEPVQDARDVMVASLPFMTAFGGSAPIPPWCSMRRLAVSVPSLLSLRGHLAADYPGPLDRYRDGRRGL